MTMESRLYAELDRRRLTSVMNETKWRELANAVETELSFRPAYQMKLVLEAEPYPADFEKDTHYECEWSGAEMPSYKFIEWLRVRPRILRPNRQTMSASVESIEAEFLAIVKRLGIPHRVDGDCVWIYGYADSRTIGTLAI